MPVSQHLAFDLGASSGRALLGTLRDGALHTEEVHRFETPLLEEGERLFWGLDALEAAVEEGLRAGLDVADALESVSVDSWAVDTVPLGADGTPLRNPRSYRDPRTEAAMKRAFERVPPDELYERTGIQLLRINTLYQILADLTEEPDLVRETACRLFIADYFHYRLSGRTVADRSMASTSQLVNARTQDWDRHLMERFGIDPEPWPEIVPPGTRLGALGDGALGADLIEERGRPAEEDRPAVLAGCTHDTACAVAAVPAEPDTNWAYVSCGTWSLVGVEQEDPILTDAAREAGFTNEIGLDGTIRFLKNRTGLWVLEECRRAWAADGRDADYDTLQAEAETASIAGTVDLDESCFLEPGDMPGKLARYCREAGQPVPSRRGEFVRLTLRSLAADYQETIAQLESLTGTTIDVVHVVGGGARNDLLCQWTADACGRRVLAGPAEATALGNLLIQARTMGGLPNGQTIREGIRATATVRTYTPHNER
jgi:rhamnulokinase